VATQLQVALDAPLDRSLKVLEAAAPYVDIVEIGTPLVFREGMSAVRQVRERFPGLPVLADLKIIDAGEEEARLAFEAGADLVTVLGVAPDVTLLGALRAAGQAGGRVVADMMQVPDPVERAMKLLAMGCHVICVHTAYDLQQAGQTPLRMLDELRRKLPHAALAVAGGLGPENVKRVLPYHPAVVVVGGAITGAADPAHAARAIREALQTW
jgi:3-hexulose-6-phosphate synthase